MLVMLCAWLIAQSAHPHEQFVVHAPKATLTLEIARTEEQREYGLMNRHSLATHTGMVFVFPNDGQVAFWMKDTLIPLDMIFVGHNGTVRKIFADVPVVDPALPDEKIPLQTGRANYVIELAAHEAAADGIIVGTKLTSLSALSTNQ